MGGRRLSTGSSNTGAASPNANRGHASGTTQRHRYVRDGEVPVVHAALGRQAARPDAASTQDKALIDQLRQELDRERAGREAAERSLHETRMSLTATQTRLAHIEMDLQAAQEQNTALAALPPASLASSDSAPPARRKPRAERPADEPDDEPQPVKWWIRDE